jgi:hypothetical protein
MKKIGRPTKLTPELQAKIAECFFVAFTDEQTATYCGISSRTIERIRRSGQFCRAVKRAELEREMKYRQRIWNGRGYWQGAAWFLERKYPTQFAKPEIQLALTQNVATGPTNILVIGPERATVLATRFETIRAKTRELLERSNRDGNGNAEH